MKKPQTDRTAGALKNSQYNNLPNTPDFTKSTAKKDGRNMAIMLQTMKGGLSTFNVVFEALEEQHFPYWDQRFRMFFEGELHG